MSHRRIITFKKAQPTEYDKGQAIAWHFQHAFSQSSVRMPKKYYIKEDNPNRLWYTTNNAIAKDHINKDLADVKERLAAIDSWPQLRYDNRPREGVICIPTYPKHKDYKFARGILGRWALTAQLFQEEYGCILVNRASNKRVYKSTIDALAAASEWNKIYYNDDFVYLKDPPMFMREFMKLTYPKYVDRKIPASAKEKPPTPPCRMN